MVHSSDHSLPAPPGALPEPVGAKKRRVSTARVKPALVSALWLAAVAVLGIVMWEGYKAFGQAFEDQVPVIGLGLPVATDDTSMPHISEIVGSLFDPVNRSSEQILLVNLLGESLVTLKETFVGLVVAAALGLLIALVFLRVRPLRAGLLPWMIASQTVPLVAIAPMIVVWGGQAGLPGWVAVSVISTYLAFFPIAINTLRGLSAAGATELELMRSLGAGQTTTLRLLRFPNSLPYVFTGLRLAATAAVVGAIVGELSAGTGEGLGRAILNFSYYYSIGPEKLYAAVFIAALTGMALVGFVWLVEHFALRNRSARSKPEGRDPNVAAPGQVRTSN